MSLRCIKNMECSLQSLILMEFRHYKDIVALKLENRAPLAFHARNLEVAEISEELWAAMKESSSSLPELEELKSWEAQENPDVKSASRSTSVRSLTINVTQICNLKCTYCAAGGDGTYGAAQTKISVEKTLPQLKFFLEKVPQGGSFHISFLGGEPLLYPEGIQAIASYVRSETSPRNISARFSIVTNGTLINENTLGVLKDIKADVTVSLDGPAEINDQVRPMKNGQGSTRQVTLGLAALVAAKSELGSLTLHGVFSRSNLEVLSAYRFFREFDVEKFEFTYSVEENSQDSNQEFIRQMNLIAAEAYQLGGEKELRKIALFDQYFRALDTQQKTENYCGAGKSFLMIDARNNLFTCPWDVGIKEEQVGFGTHLDEEKLRTYEDRLIEKNNCQKCWARFLCGGGCMFVHKKATGNKHLKDDQFCIRTRSLIATTLLYYTQSRTAC